MRRNYFSNNVVYILHSFDSLTEFVVVVVFSVSQQDEGVILFVYQYLSTIHSKSFKVRDKWNYIKNTAGSSITFNGRQWVFFGGAHEKGDGNAEIAYHVAIIASVITPIFLRNKAEYSWSLNCEGQIGNLHLMQWLKIARR